MADSTIDQGRPSRTVPRSSRSAGDARDVDPRALQEVITFLREWLPPSAIRTYREMIQRDPMFWHRHPHFREGIVVKQFLRGNGITERVLGVDSLENVWPEILRLTVEEVDPPQH